MNVRPSQKPLLASNRAIDSLPRPEERQEKKPLPSEDGVFTIDDFICPWQRVMFNEGVLEVDDDGNVKNLRQVLRSHAGATYTMSHIANHAAKKLTHGGNWSAFWADDFNAQDLAGSSLDHDADSQILRNGFNQERVDRALTFSTDGERLTLEDLRAFQKANLEEEPGRRGEIFGGAEFALLIKVFGRTDANGVKFIKNKDFVRLFKEAKWPEDWEPPAKNSLSAWSTGFAVKEYFSTETGGETKAMAAASGEGAKKTGKAACPFLNGQPYDIAEAAKQHADKLQ